MRFARVLSGARRRRLLAAASGGISAMLFAVRRALFIFVIWAGGGLAIAGPASALAWQEDSQTPAQIPAPPPAQPTPTPPQQPAPAQNLTPPAAAVHTGPVIVINAAHGGTDDGARADNGLLEKNVVLIFARMLRSEFERQGFRVVMTRNDDSNPSYEDRAAVANAYRDAIFISLHISSTGALGATRTYSYQFSTPVATASAAAGADTSGAPGAGVVSVAPAPVAPSGGLIVWAEAQRPYAETSHRLADALQAALAQKFAGSPGASARFAVRELRSVAAPAIAVEVSTISVSDANSLLAMGASLAATIERSVQAVRPQGSSAASISAPGGK
jgi:N-acetylmuramoyl-L-alanine amidase